ncbi:MAG TPA: response regulator [Candidatus Sulfotelmatobacter sp.]|jgi:CheY-like chemotaxis protein|nr:response regulator [Candidatus Sulfotelmatobacter sp.]
MSKILIIEDDKILLEMYKDKFTNERFDVQTAIDGQAGIEKMKAFQPDVVLLDLIMPNINGFEFLKLIKIDPIFNKIPVIVLTNIYADAEDLVKNWGVKYFLLKSDYTPETIAEKVKQIIGQASPTPPSQ